MNHIQRFFLISLCIVLCAVYPATAESQFLFFKHPLTNQAAPDFTLPLLDGTTTTLSAYRNGKPAILFFWAIDCPHCRRALRELKDNQASIRANGVQLILINLGDSPRRVQGYMNNNKISLTTFLDESTSQLQPYQVFGVPTYFLVDAQGVVRVSDHSLPENYLYILAP